MQDETSCITDDRLPRIQGTGPLSWAFGLEMCWGTHWSFKGPTNAFQTGDGWVAAGVFFLYLLVSPGVMKVVCVCSAVRGHCGDQCAARVFMFF